MEIGVKAGAASVLIGFGFANDPLKIKERTIRVNDKMCLGIHTSLSNCEFLWGMRTISFNKHA